MPTKLGYLRYVITRADKIIASISYIRTVNKNKATIEKILVDLSKSEICDKTWSTKSLKELLSDMTAKDQIELDDDDKCNFVNLETVIISEIQQTSLLPSHLSVTPTRPIKSVNNDNAQSFISSKTCF